MPKIVRFAESLT